MNRLKALAEDPDLSKGKGLLLALFVSDIEVLEQVASNLENSPFTDRLLAGHPEPSVRAAVARKIGLGVLASKTVQILETDPDPQVRDIMQKSQAGDWNWGLPTDEPI